MLSPRMPEIDFEIDTEDGFVFYHFTNVKHPIYFRPQRKIGIEIVISEIIIYKSKFKNL